MGHKHAPKKAKPRSLRTAVRRVVLTGPAIALKIDRTDRVSTARLPQSVPEVAREAECLLDAMSFGTDQTVAARIARWAEAHPSLFASSFAQKDLVDAVRRGDWTES